MDKKSDHDLLIEVNADVKSLMTQFTNHLHHHLVYTLALFGSLLSIVGGLVIYWATHQS